MMYLVHVEKHALKEGGKVAELFRSLVAQGCRIVPCTIRAVETELQESGPELDPSQGKLFGGEDEEAGNV